MTPGFDDEDERVVTRRRELWSLASDVDEEAALDAPRMGLALSGGGIRSATFSLGLMQALKEVPADAPDALSVATRSHDASFRSLLARFDYLSTVSGGGYIGVFFCSLFVPSRLMSPVAPARWPEPAERARDAAALAFDVMADNPPGRMRREAEARQAEARAAEGAMAAASRESRIAQPLAWLRENGRYLAPTGAGDLLYAAALAIRNWLAVQYVLATVIVAALALLMLSREAIVVALALMVGPVEPGVGTAVIWLIGAAVFLLWAVPAGVAFWLASPDRGCSDASVPKHWSRAAIGDLVIGVLLCASIAMRLAARVGGVEALGRHLWRRDFGALGIEAFDGFFLVIGIHALLGFAVYAFTRGGRSVVEHRVVLTRSLANALQVTALVCLFALADTVGRTTYEWMVEQMRQTQAVPLKPAAIATSVGGALMWAIRKGAGLVDGAGTKLARWTLPLDFVAGVLATGIVFALIVFWVVLIDAMVWNMTLPVVHGASQARMLCLVFALSVVVAIVVGQFPAFINLSSLQSLYGARLTRAYLGASNGERLEKRVEAESVATPHGGSVAEPLPSDQLSRARYYARDVLAPLHVINVTVNQTTDSNEMLVQRDRKGLPLAVLPTGFTVDGLYYPYASSNDTHEAAWHRRLTGLHDSELTIGQWVGTSGAAVATGLGRTTTPGLSMLLGLANVRLGTWWLSGQGAKPVPFAYERTKRRLARTMSAVFATQAYLLAELTARFHGLQRTRQYLSDGGHFDNTGIYELLRPARRIRLIVASDSGADVTGRFDDFANLVRLARIDYRLEISINHAVCDDAILGRVFGRPEELASPTRSNKCAMLYDVFALDDGRRESVPVCRIVVVKPRAIDCVPIDVRQYAATHATFPNESTAQQFFDEAQWESYRRLGVAIGRAVFGTDADSDPRHAETLWRVLSQGTLAEEANETRTFARDDRSNGSVTSRPSTMKRLVAGALALLALASCAHPDGLRPGLTRDELDARFGRPAATRPEGAGEVRIYTSQPLGQRASAAHLDASGRVTSVEALLNTEHFATIKVDAWDKAEVFSHFGPPAEVTRTLRYEVWSYRYREAETWYSLFSVMFDPAGVVRQTQNGPDPMYDPKDRGRL